MAQKEEKIPFYDNIWIVGGSVFVVGTLIITAFGLALLMFFGWKV